MAEKLVGRLAASARHFLDDVPLFFGKRKHLRSEGLDLRVGRLRGVLVQVLQAIDGLLQAGYLEDWRYHETLSGAPQGGVLSPLLSNIYLNRLDRYVETTLLPVYNRGRPT